MKTTDKPISKTHKAALLVYQVDRGYILNKINLKRLTQFQIKKTRMTKNKCKTFIREDYAYNN